MARHVATGCRAPVIFLALALLVGGPLSALAAPDGPDLAPFGPESAAVPPEIDIARVAGTNNAALNWWHLEENEGYQVWRDVAPYFDPGAGEGNQVAYRSAASCGSPCFITVIDDGVDRYAADGTLPTVQVIGDVAVNYFWVVRGQNGEGASGNSNRAGEFDFGLVKGS
jgi:hypothetical protein